ncbi:MAG: C13 family peptidase, partial [Prevotellaceae bacterium]|nr:C13 family peptidase [Prevotellaceae bacterium]
MKRIILIIGLIFIGITINAQVSKEQAITIVKKEILQNDTSNIHLYINKNTVSAGSSINTMYQNIVSPSFNSFMFFVDDSPYQNWAHPSRFIFIGLNGQVEIITYNYPPSLGTMDILIEKKYYIPNSNYDYKIKKNNNVIQNISTSHNEYAVIISGGYDIYNNYERYWNDCAAIYSTLVNVYNYNPTHIYVLISDGTNPANDRRRLNGTYDSSPLDLDGNGTNDINYAATKANIISVFNTLSNGLTTNDNLFIYTTDHGGRHSGNNVFLYLWGETMEDYEFATEVNKINAKSINVVMEQCYSGGFIDNISATNRVITTSCKADELSYAMSNLIYDEFVYHWTSAVASQTPTGTIVNADSNNDGIISINEAFIYAQSHDTKSETPQYSSNPNALGTSLSLKGITTPLAISGTSSLCVNSSGTYTVTNAPSGFTWSCSSNLTKTSSSGNTATFKANSDGTGKINILVGNSIMVSKTVQTGTPAGSIQGPYGLSCNCLTTIDQPGNYRLSAINLSESVPSNDIEWQVIPPTEPFIYLYVGANPVVSFPEVGNYTVKMRWKGTCGYSPYTTKTIKVPEYMFYSYSAAYPNPAGNELIIDREETNSNGIAANAITGEQNAQAK